MRSMMKRFDDHLTLSESRFLDCKHQFVSEIFSLSGLNKGLPLKSRVSAVHYLGCLVGNLCEAVMLGRNLALPISSPDPTPTVKNRIIKTLLDEGYATGFKRGYSFKTSSLNLPTKDLSKIEPHPKIFEAFDPTAVTISKRWSVFVRQGNDDILVKSRTRDHSLMVKAATKFQKRINIPLYGFRRIFNENETLGGRIYAKYQHMPKELRSLITIDNEKTTELDFRYNQIRMLFSIAGEEDSGDPYAGFVFDRSVVKKAMNTLINSENPKRVFCDMRFGAPFRWSSSVANDFMSTAFGRYPILKQMKGTGIGLQLQKLEGDIVLDILEHALYNNSVVMPVHDSFIIKEAHSEEFDHVMEEIWQNNVGMFKKHGFHGV